MAEADRFRPHALARENRPDGTVILRSELALGPVTRRSGDWLRRWAEEAPGRVFVAERAGAGWRAESYAAALEKARAIASALIGRGLTAETPILILSGNGVDHALLTLGAQYAGIPTVPVAEQYALIPGAHRRLRHVVELTRPALAFAEDADAVAEALALDAFAGLEIVASRPGATGATPFEALLAGDAGADAEAAFEKVGPETVAKILMTSGSSSAPKGVPTTQRMMCVNQAQIAAVLPFLAARPPVILDWLPWNHVFGGSHNFNMMLANGGSLYIDDGKPLPGRFGRTLENMALVAGTMAFNVPVGYAMLAEALRADAGLRRRFFDGLDMIFYAGAALPPEVWRALEEMAGAEGAAPLITTSWGLTETAPAALIRHEPPGRPGVIGVPVPGLEAKLVPVGDDRHEIRVRGPNVFEGYLHDPERTADAFDAEGFFRTGDAVRFAEVEAPSVGLAFDGRMSEEFKLDTGTWVRSAELRLAALGALAPLAADVVLCGEGRHELGLMIFPDRGALARAGLDAQETGGALVAPALAEAVAARLAALPATGSATRIARAMVLSAPPDMGAGEITAKGNLNPRAVQAARAELLDRLYDDADPACILIGRDMP